MGTQLGRKAPPQDWARRNGFSILFDRTDGPGRLGCGTFGIGTLVERTAPILVVVEDASDPSGLAPVLEVEVFIAPGFEPRGFGRIDGVAGRFQSAMKVPGILQEGVIGVRSAPPPNHHTGPARNSGN